MRGHCRPGTRRAAATALPAASRAPVAWSPGTVTALMALLALLAAAFLPRPAAADPRPPFSEFLESLWPDARDRFGVSRRTFDTATRDLKPDMSLPDLEIPGQPKRKVQQAEFTREPRDYLRADTLARLAATGRQLARTHKAALERIEAEFGVDRYSVLAIFGRETAFGSYTPPHDAIRVLATQAWTGRRSEMFRDELLHALKLLEKGTPRAAMRASWAGAMGLTQFMPSEFFAHTFDADGDGQVDLFKSVPDALASAARQLANKGWVRGQTWGYEIVIPPAADCSLEGPPGSRIIAEWQALGFRRADGRPFPADVMQATAYLMSPAGAHGPSFLALENFQVIRRYNTSDLYATFVGNLADRIAGGGDFLTPWKPIGPQRTELIRGIQQGLKDRGYAIDIVDGFIGSNTRRQIGQYQRANGLTVDCWPSDRLIAHITAQAG